MVPLLTDVLSSCASQLRGQPLGVAEAELIVACGDAGCLDEQGAEPPARGRKEDMHPDVSWFVATDADCAALVGALPLARYSGCGAAPCVGGAGGGGGIGLGGGCGGGGGDGGLGIKTRIARLQCIRGAMTGLGLICVGAAPSLPPVTLRMLAAALTSVLWCVDPRASAQIGSRLQTPSEECATTGACCEALVEACQHCARLLATLPLFGDAAVRLPPVSPCFVRCASLSVAHSTPIAARLQVVTTDSPQVDCGLSRALAVLLRRGAEGPPSVLAAATDVGFGLLANPGARISLVGRDLAEKVPRWQPSIQGASGTLLRCSRGAIGCGRGIVEIGSEAIHSRVATLSSRGPSRSPRRSSSWAQPLLVATALFAARLEANRPSLSDRERPGSLCEPPELRVCKRLGELGLLLESWAAGTTAAAIEGGGGALWADCPTRQAQAVVALLAIACRSPAGCSAAARSSALPRCIDLLAPLLVESTRPQPLAEAILLALTVVVRGAPEAAVPLAMAGALPLLRQAIIPEPSPMPLPPPTLPPPETPPIPPLAASRPPLSDAAARLLFLMASHGELIWSCLAAGVLSAAVDALLFPRLDADDSGVEIEVETEVESAAAAAVSALLSHPQALPPLLAHGEALAALQLVCERPVSAPAAAVATAAVAEDRLSELCARGALEPHPRPYPPL